MAPCVPPDTTGISPAELIRVILVLAEFSNIRGYPAEEAPTYKHPAVVPAIVGADVWAWKVMNL
jgi:hypothetical protein